jgi:EmrB/QacA subfamily drug resistance transporter
MASMRDQGPPRAHKEEAVAVVATELHGDETQVASEDVSHKLVFAIVAIALFMGAVDLTIVATALPAIHRSLGASINWVGWTITIYGLSVVIVLPIAGRLANRFGRQRLFLMGVALFTASSLLCGFATNIYVLIAFRAMQAVGGGALQPSAAGLIADHFGRDRDRGIGLFGTINAVGQVVGPVLGGILVGYLSWRWIFFVNVPVGVVLVWLTIRFIPESPKASSGSLDLRGLLLFSTATFAAILAITIVGDRRTALDSPLLLSLAATAIVLLWAFLRHTRRSVSPFIPSWLLFGRGFAAMNTLNLLQGFVTFGVASLVPLYAEQRYHLDPLSAGGLLTARALGAIAIGLFAVFALRRTGYRLPIFVGFCVIATGTILMSVAPRWGVSAFVWLSICVAIIGLGLGTVNPAASNACMGLAPDQAAAITGLRSMFLNLGVIFCVSITTAILNRSSDPGITQAHVFWVVTALILVAMPPLVARIPEHKGHW